MSISRELALHPSSSAFDEQLADRLQESPLFNPLTGSETLALARHLRVHHVAPGAWIFREGDAGDFLGVILDGHVEILKSDDSGQSHLIADARSGKTVGEMALIDGERRSASCRCVASTELAILARKDYEKLVESAPALAYKLVLRLARLMSQRLRQTTGHMLDHLG